MSIKYIQHKNIDKVKWDKCIEKSFNGIIYGYSWYLDLMTTDWDALIEDDYVSVFPLPRKRKMGIDYLTQPFFTQQLGVFSTHKLGEKKIHEFLSQIPSRYKYIDILLNKFNVSNHAEFTISKNTTCELDLISSYKLISKSYSDNTKRNIKKAIKHKVTIVKGLQVNELVDLFRANMGKSIKHIKTDDYENLIRLISHCQFKQKGTMYAAYTATNKLCAAAFFAQSHNKAIFLFSASNEESKKNGAMFLLIDEFIRTNSEKNLILDFEGSNDKGLARFYKGFGSIACEYLRVKRNKLPFPIKYLKR